MTRNERNEVLELAVRKAKEAVDASAALSGEQFKSMQAEGLDAEQMAHVLAIFFLDDAHNSLELGDEDDDDEDG